VTELDSIIVKSGRYVFPQMNSKTIINWLGCLGLIPFFVLSSGCWFFRESLGRLASQGFILYSLGIFCFLGGTLWGVAPPLTQSVRTLRLIVSNVFAVLAVISVWLVNVLEASK
jgi:hypothetical protein